MARSIDGHYAKSSSKKCLLNNIQNFTVSCINSYVHTTLRDTIHIFDYMLNKRMLHSIFSFMLGKRVYNALCVSFHVESWVRVKSFRAS